MAVIALRNRGDIALYVISAAFAGLTALTSTLLPHRAWGAIAVFGYLLAALISLVPLRLAQRFWLALGAWLAVAAVPLTVQAIQRAGGRTDRAQEEVLVVEESGARLLHTGSPYLDRDAIAALPADERLLGYTPYQPGMALFGLPRAVFGGYWWTDARIWFAIVTAVVLALAHRVLRNAASPERLLRVAQAATVLPICALTLATGGDDIPVLALSLLAFAYAARLDFRAAGIAIGVAAALKLFAWPIAAVLFVLALRNGRRAALTFALPAAGLPLLALLPAIAVNADAVIENVIRFPGGHGLVTSPAQSPLPGYLIASNLPAGRTIALGLLLLAGLAIAIWLFRRPPRDAAGAALVSAIGLTAAIMLTPTTRFGYLLYPIAYATAWWAIRSPDAATGRTQGR
jgi:hypothetical protein